MGAMRLVKPPLPWWDHPHGKMATLDDLPQALAASSAIGRGRELAADFQFLMDHGTSLGGATPKVSLLDADGHLSLVKIPLMRDNLDALRSEMLAIELARQSGINTVSARLHEVEHRGLVLLIKRLDRAAGGDRKHHISAATLLQAGHDEDITYLDLLSAMRGACTDFAADAQQLWRRLVFNLLITHVDDGLWVFRSNVTGDSGVNVTDLRGDRNERSRRRSHRSRYRNDVVCHRDGVAQIHPPDVGSLPGFRLETACPQQGSICARSKTSYVSNFMRGFHTNALPPP